MDPVLHYHRPDAPAPLLPRLWHLVKPLVIGLPLVVLLGVGMGMLTYGIGMPSEAPPTAVNMSNYSYYSAWESARREQRDRASVMGIGAGLLTGGLTTAVLYLIRLLRQGPRPSAAPPPPGPAGGAAPPWPAPPPAVRS